LPIGVSFVTFEALSYVVDVYRGETRAARNPLHVAFYISFFPHLIAGPILRFRDIAGPLNGPTVRLHAFDVGVSRFVDGLAKKTLLANTLGLLADQIFGLTAAQLNAPVASVDGWLQHQDQRRIEYAHDGARYIVAIAPNKQTMYPDKVPRRYGPHASGVLDFLMTRARYFPELDVLDLRPVLKAHADEQLFRRADSHWNANGAFYAAQAILNRLRASLPNVGTLRHEDYAVTRTPIEYGDLANMLGMRIGFADDAYKFERRSPPSAVEMTQAAGGNSEQLHRVFEQPDPKLPRAILLGDSFGGVLAPRLADGFSRLHYYYSARAGYDPKLVPREHPDVVVLLLVERYLGSLATQ
jgi:SGNH hydrolase-like domain, acetyltransferase AlgX